MRLVFSEAKYRSCRCFCVILEKVCFLFDDVAVIGWFSSFSVSSAGLRVGLLEESVGMAG